MKHIALPFALLTLFTATSLSADDAAVLYEISLTPSALAVGVKPTAHTVAAAYAGALQSDSVDERRGTFILRIKPKLAALMRGDPRIKAATPVQHPAVLSDAPSMDLGDYVYDGAGNIESIGNDQFRYDLASRLKSATVNGAANNQTFTYDTFGNRTDTARPANALQCVGSTACEMAAPVASTTNHLSSATYDEAGNVKTLDGTYTYSYDALNMVRSAGSREYVYTPNDERIGSLSGGVWSWTLRSAGQQVLRELTSSGGTNGTTTWTWTRDHIWRGTSLLAVEQKMPSGATVTRHFHLDHLGTPRLVTNAAGQRIGVHAYYPFGTELISSTTESPADNIKFTGHEWDDLGGDVHSLTYMHARYYSAALGRFLSVDPTWSSADLGTPQSWNRYSYVLNNPVRYTDPDGRCTNVLDCTIEGFAVGDVPGAVIGAGVGLVLGYGVTHANEVVTVGSSMGGGSGGENFAENWIRQNNNIHMAEKQEQENKGTAGGDRSGKRFTPKGKQEIHDRNAQKNGGENRCEDCDRKVDPAKKSQKGVTPPGNERQADHIIPRSKGGDGSPSNGQTLCRDCNIDKKDKMPPQ